MKQENLTIPAEAVELYTRYIHGEVSRRDFLDKVSRYAVVGMSAAAIVDRLMPNYALGQQIRKDDERIKATYETIPSPNGNGYIRGYFVRPFSQDTRSATPTKLPAVLVIHENRGLNPHTEDVARRFALENFIAFAPDALTTVGGYPNDDYQGGQLFGKIDRAKLTQDLSPAPMVESQCFFHRQSLCNRLLLRRRRIQHSRYFAGRGSGGCRTILRRRARGGRSGENQSGDTRAPRRPRYTTRQRVDRV